MPHRSNARTARLSAVLLAACLSVGHGQNPPAGSPAPPAAATSAPAQPDAEAAFLARAASLYYSTAKTGLTGFDCAVHPDWLTLFRGANKDTPVTASDARVVLLNRVVITLHARFDGGSTLDWAAPANPDTPPGLDSNSLITGMQHATEQTLMGFLQFWTPFMDGSVLPASPQGLSLTHTDAGTTIHGIQGGTEITEIFNPQMLLQQFNVKESGNSVQFAPTFQPTEQGLLVNRFLANIQPRSNPPGPVEEMHASIAYQSLEGFPIPQRINMEVVGAGVFNFALDGCQIRRRMR